MIALLWHPATGVGTTRYARLRHWCARSRFFPARGTSFKAGCRLRLSPVRMRPRRFGLVTGVPREAGFGEATPLIQDSLCNGHTTQRLSGAASPTETRYQRTRNTVDVEKTIEFILDQQARLQSMMIEPDTAGCIPMRASTGPSG